jgi:hypothetical protein
MDVIANFLNKSESMAPQTDRTLLRPLMFIPLPRTFKSEKAPHSISEMRGFYQIRQYSECRYRGGTCTIQAQ